MPAAAPLEVGVVAADVVRPVAVLEDVAAVLVAAAPDPVLSDEHGAGERSGPGRIVGGAAGGGREQDERHEREAEAEAPEPRGTAELHGRLHRRLTHASLPECNCRAVPAGAHGSAVVAGSTGSTCLVGTGAGRGRLDLVGLDEALDASVAQAQPVGRLDPPAQAGAPSGADSRRVAPSGRPG